MPMSNSLNLVDYEKYQELLVKSVPSLSAFVVLDNQDQCIWSHGSSEIILSNWDIVTTQNGCIEHVVVDRISSDLTMLGHPISCSNNKPIGMVYLLLQHLSEDQLRTYETILHQVSLCIQTEYSLNAELEQMATELSDRYDELNLVYDTNDDVKQLEEVKVVLKHLVSNCITYLDVDFAALILHDKKICMHALGRNMDITKSHDILSFLKECIVPASISNEIPLILNRVEDYQKLKIDIHPSWKVLSFPVLDAKGVIEGSLICLYENTHEDFSNSDRNILEAMARKVTKIIQSNYDPLTGLINRQSFEGVIRTHWKQSRETLATHSLAYFDLDQIQIINDIAAHAAGDALIKQVGQLLSDNIRDYDKISRLGGDVFAIIFPNQEIDEAYQIVEKLRKLINEIDFSWSERDFSVSASIGLTEISPQTDSIESILSTAEVACNTAKESGRNQIKVYQSDSTEITRRKDYMIWVNRIQLALKENRFELFVQKIEPLTEIDEDYHYEVLLRMWSEDNKLLAPGQFMPAAERYTIMPLIDTWVVENTLNLLNTFWHQLKDMHGHISINLSGQSLSQDGFADFLIQQISSSRINPANLCFEITETAAIDNMAKALDFIQRVKALGCKFSLDDFGTGVSSFTYLKNLPVDYLKIDGSFIKEILTDKISSTMVAAISQVAMAMHISTIGEFVENNEIKHKLQDLGISYAQGYAIAKPTPMNQEIMRLLKSNRHRVAG